MIKTIDEALTFIKANKVEMIDFKIIDLDGRWRHITIPATNFKQELFETGIGFDASNYGYAPVENSDMVFVPDLSTLTMDPFTKIPTVNMVGDVLVIGKENVPFNQYPRSIIKKAEAYMKETKMADKMLLGPEFEFHIFDHVAFEIKSNSVFYHVDTSQAEWHSGKRTEDNNGYQVSTKGGYHIDIPNDINYDLRSKMCTMLEDWGVKVKYHHHEVGGSGQQEIEVAFDSLCKVADNTMVAKYIIKNAANKANKTVTFMPKPLSSEAGNGMHIHMMLFKDGKPLFYDESGYAGLSEFAMYFMGGILKHIHSLCAFTNPSTNSYKRLIPGYEAPVTIGYATANRSAVVRIPAYAKKPNVKRFELRNPDASSNPYFAYSAILMAGLDGVINKIHPKEHNWGPFDFNLYTLSEEDRAKIEVLPRTLNEALDALEIDYEYLLKGDVFPKKLLDIWIKEKRLEVRKINNIPHPAEFKKYYDF
ncbi:MAG: type I glutamate--ammonia ligase [Tenericutes bacterium]|nr:type I glutamate--ammonia ligase [Mycoplasmatota bacterium]